jgi:hypothetical protein
MHSPGPWRNAGPWHKSISIEDAHGEEVAKVEDSDENYPRSHPTEVEARANVRLVLRAPEMLDLLKDVNSALNKPEEERHWQLLVRVQKLIYEVDP